VEVLGRGEKAARRRAQMFSRGSTAFPPSTSVGGVSPPTKKPKGGSLKAEETQLSAGTSGSDDMVVMDVSMEIVEDKVGRGNVEEIPVDKASSPGSFTVD